MKPFGKLVLAFTALLFVFSTPIFADSKSDYEYQYSQYRQNYIEYNLLKKDFLDNPTLDNQQKAVLAAKQTIYSRDLAKSNYAAYLLSLVKENNVSYTPIDPLITSLSSARDFFANEALKSQSIVTPNDLKTFSAAYTTGSLVHDRSFRTGVVAYKIAKLVRFQLNLKNSLDILLPKLSKPYSTSLQARIDDLQTQGNNINTTIDTFTNKLFSEEQTVDIDSENYFTDKSETIKKIQSLQIKWVDSLIDIDLNYAHS